MSAIFSKITSIIMSIITAISLLPTSIVKFVTSDESLIEKMVFSNYNEVSEKFCEIPGLDTDFVPQGLAYSDRLDKVLICGYMNDGGASRIYVIDPVSGECEKYVSLTETDGEEYTGHCGGIAAFEGNAWVVSGKYARRLPLDTLRNAENDASVQFVDKFNSGTRASYINCSNGILWIGEYHKNGDTYVTEESHHLVSPDGEKMNAWTCGYVLESGNPQGFDYNGASKEIVTPGYILGTESMCQGFAQLPDGRFVTSISGQITKSELNTYNNVLEKEHDGTVTVGENEVRIWFLDSSERVSSLNALPRSEGVDCYNGKLLMLYESAAQKMLASQIVRTEFIWSTEI
ncbi:MAG: hypothetical protein E7555_00730 [Ruminococcaceae bacterium]|nr:hypothetical protein [Oscillospiraceae bacterium]